jgi:hypothetical protein
MALGPSAWLINSMWDAALLGIPFVVNQPYVQFHNGDPGSGGTANVIALDRQPALFERDVNGHWQTAGAPMEVPIDIADTTITHISWWDGFTSGNWAGNMIANQPVLVVEGDLLILSDKIQWTVTDWIA